MPFLASRVLCAETITAESLHTDNDGNVKSEEKDFSGGTVVKNPPANAGDTGSGPGLGRSHMPRSN